MHYSNDHLLTITYSDQHYNLIVFEKIMQLVLTFRTYVLEIAKNDEESLLAFINLVSFLPIKLPMILVILPVTRDNEWC
jgi:hypothetical protein